MRLLCKLTAIDDTEQAFNKAQLLKLGRHAILAGRKLVRRIK